MLISSTHHSTKLPADLTYAYAAYKKGTARIIKWLRTAATPAFLPCSPQPPPSPIAVRTSLTVDCGHQPLTLDDIRALADYVISHSITVPEEVLYSFHNTLEARDCMTCWYQQVSNDADGENTNGHLVFNAVFRGIYKDLRNVGRRLSKTPMTCCESGICDRHEPALLQFSNAFSCLDIYDTDDTIPSGQETKRTDSKNWSTEATEKQTIEERDELSIKDDTLERMMCLHVYQSELSQLSNLVKDSHTKAGEGTVSLAVTAATTRLAYHAARKIGHNLSQYDIHTPHDSVERMLNHEQQPGCPPHSNINTVPGELLVSLNYTWQTLSAFKNDFRDRGVQCCSCPDNGKYAFQDACQWFGLDEEEALKLPAEAASLNTMLRTMVLRLQQMKACQHPGRYICLQILSDLDTFLREDEKDSSIACHLTFGLHLLIESYKAYLAGAKTRPAGWKSATVNPRLASLKVASTLKNEIKLMMNRDDAPCCCLKIDSISVVQQLDALNRKLEVFLATPRFELLIQSPWISGEHMVENIVLASRYGFKAWHHGYYVGLIFHTYNALVHTGFLTAEELPVLEDLCNSFESEVFMGCRKAAKPYTAYKRWTGGHLKFVGHNRHSAAGNRNWDMCITADPSKGGDKPARAFAPGKISLFALLTNNKDFLDLDVVERIVGERESTEISLSTIKRNAIRLRSELLASNSYSAYITTIRQIFQAEFSTSSFTSSHNVTSPTTTPVTALLNPFLVYRLCISTLSAISDQTHSTKEQGILCRCVCERTLSAAEHWMTANKTISSTGKRTLFADKEAAGICKKELVKVFGGLTREDVVWKF